ncbi:MULTISPECIES: GNAT family N-acetyltransferase [unclassified Adlercreutzia]|uniref:GNAT family N-acetyltransferase n=1 Tax=unclassified Adlercreutzia TaxID=2636013 RepID=UPI0013EE0D90|nr:MULTISPECIES: GNAT family N-acetyltransferase [unclassified Adlercreutzia]
MASGQLFTLRPAEERDRAYLDSYTYAEGMDYLPSLENVTVAANDADEPVGFIRIAQGANGFAHVNPVVVYESWRGHAVGRALVDDAQRTFGELRLVARGASKPFYDALGFTCCAWDEVDVSVTEDCDGCPLSDECNPQPMRRAAIPTRP